MGSAVSTALSIVGTAIIAGATGGAGLVIAGGMWGTVAIGATMVAG